MGLCEPYITSNLKNLRKFVCAYQCIGGNRWDHRNRDPHYDLTKICGGVKYVCMVCIRPTEKFQQISVQVSGSINSDPLNMILNL